MKTSTLQLIAYLILTLLLTACGSQKSSLNDTQSSDFSSRDYTGQQNRNTRISGQLADCNQFDSTSSELGGLLTSSYIPGTSQVDPETIRMRLIKAPTEITANSSYKLEMYLFGEDTQGNIISKDSPVSFKFQSLRTGVIVSNSLTEISKPVIDTVIDTIYGTNSTYTVSSFLKEHIILLENVSIQYDAISLALYPKAGGEVLTHVNFLIPQFFADPNVYANTHYSSQLQALHPNYSQRTAYLSDQAYFQNTERYCEKFHELNPSL